MLMASFSVNADTRVEQVWTCTLNDGNTAEDLNAVHGKWLAWANKQTYGGDIRGYVVSSLVGAEFSVVLLIDSYPDLTTYAADIDAYYASEGQALDAEYDAISSCSSSALYTVIESGSD
jgi:argininosuccinate synthase